MALCLVSALRENGVETEIATTRDFGGESSSLRANERNMYCGVPTWFFAASALKRKEFIFSWSLLRWLKRNVRNYDLIDIHYLFTFSSTCAALQARKQNIPYTIRTMGQLSPWALNQSKHRKRLYSALFERRALREAAGIHCTSIGEEMDVKNFGITRPIYTLPLGAKKEPLIADARQSLRHRLGLRSDSLIALFLSRLHPKKRPELVLDAAEALHRAQPNLHFVIAGAGDAEYEAELTALARSKGLETVVSFVGFVSGAEKSIFLQGSDLFMLPSYSENFGVAVAEALQAGLPVIVSSEVQLAQDIVEANAGVVIDGNQQALTSAIAQIVGNRSLRQRMSNNARTLADTRYSWNTIAKDLTGIYSSIITTALHPTALV